MLEIELLVVNAEAIENRRVQIANMNRVLCDIVTEVVGLAVNGTPLYSGSGHPHRVAAGVMVASVVLFRKRTLTVDSATKFSTPND